MNIKLDLLKGIINDAINSRIAFTEIDPDEMADTIAINALSDIQKILANDTYNDFEIVENIVCVFEKYHLDSGGQHDF